MRDRSRELALPICTMAELEQRGRGETGLLSRLACSELARRAASRPRSQTGNVSEGSRFTRVNLVRRVAPAATPRSREHHPQHPTPLVYNPASTKRFYYCIMHGTEYTDP